MAIVREEWTVCDSLNCFALNHVLSSSSEPPVTKPSNLEAFSMIFYGRGHWPSARAVSSPVSQAEHFAQGIEATITTPVSVLLLDTQYCSDVWEPVKSPQVHCTLAETICHKSAPSS